MPGIGVACVPSQSGFPQDCGLLRVEQGLHKDAIKILKKIDFAPGFPHDQIKKEESGGPSGASFSPLVAPVSIRTL